MDVELVEMSPADFERRRDALVSSYAQSLAATRGLSVPEAESVAARSIAESLADGLHTPGQLLRTAVSGDQVVGWIWISMPGTSTFTHLAWVSDVLVDPAFRARGAGRAIMLAVQLPRRDRGVDQVGLNVFGSNDPAMRLYAKLGYRVTREQRARALGDIPGSLDSGVELAGEFDCTVLAGGKEAGRVRFVDHHPDRPGIAWLQELEVPPELAAAVIAAVAADLVRRGVRSLGTDVAGADTARRRLLTKLGFQVLSQQMVKDLEPG